ncbi:MAG: hypothetical protein ABFC78_00520 [Methanoregula sp.]
MKKRREKILKIFRENTGGKTTHSPKNATENPVTLTGFQPSRVVDYVA